MSGHTPWREIKHKSRLGNGERDNATNNWRAHIPLAPTTEIPWPKENVLQEADRITDGQRRDFYGPPAEDFKKVVDMAHALWGRGPETEAEHAIYLILVKLAREANRHSRDNMVDIAGYIKCYAEIIESVDSQHGSQDHQVRQVGRGDS